MTVSIRASPHWLKLNAIVTRKAYRHNQQKSVQGQGLSIDRPGQLGGAATAPWRTTICLKLYPDRSVIGWAFQSPGFYVDATLLATAGDSGGDQ